MRVGVAVIGRGMIGAAAARHLAEAGVATALVGPGEPTDRRASLGPFSSHPDEGRITRIAGRTGPWSELAARSIARYGDIASRSGIDFHTPCGLVASFRDAAAWVRRGRALGSDARLVDPAWLLNTTGIAVGDDAPVLYEGPPAGHINPRRLVAAQTTLALAAGATVIDHAATELVTTSRGVRVGGGWGEVDADRVLVATGAFGSDLLNVRLAIDRRPRTTLMVAMADSGKIPSLILEGPPDDRLLEIYWVPPVRYPDGTTRLKIGGNLAVFDPLEPDELVPWFQSDGSDVEVEALRNSLRELLPAAEPTDYTQAPCVVTGTPTGHPYIGWIDDGIAVAIGGNGSAAKSSDELGRLAASLFLPDGWVDDLDAATFTPRFD